MNISHITTVKDITDFLKSSASCTLSMQAKAGVYKWLDGLLADLPYLRLKKKEKRIVKMFIEKVTGYHPGHIKRLIAKHKKDCLRWVPWQKGHFSGVYTREDIVLLHETDAAHSLSGPATKKILRRAYEVFEKEEYRKLANISSSHIYNIRGGVAYQRMGQVFSKTRSVVVPIGKRQKPRPNGRPGYMRVDTVHQGDKGRLKGLYWINIVDEVTQAEFVFCTPCISEKYMKPILRAMIGLCPFVIINFHSDNGGEYINYIVADILNRLHIKQTKSRSRHSNDNALVESKNGSIVREHFGYAHIPATDENAYLLNVFCINWLNPYLNYHRPCGYATTVADKRGKEKKTYETGDYETPYEKLKSLPYAERYIRRRKGSIQHLTANASRNMRLGGLFSC